MNAYQRVDPPNFVAENQIIFSLHGAATTPLPYVAKLTYIPECEKSSGRFRRLRRFFSKLTRRNSTSDDSDSEQLLEDGMPMTSDCSWYSSQPIFF
ncbi:hypothetical protein L596_001972 [Steinernema carpocapsae]|uniref:Uncharacterized protein n=1 Tax=Steinernema carpocapsae TaxID=34508 RepID=A0A4U8UNU5_STECR|nr:hypothetical protein L596_001972 [Steinernema carpocapsae]